MHGRVHNPWRRTDSGVITERARYSAGVVGIRPWTAVLTSIGRHTLREPTRGTVQTGRRSVLVLIRPRHTVDTDRRTSDAHRFARGTRPTSQLSNPARVFPHSTGTTGNRKAMLITPKWTLDVTEFCLRPGVDLAG